MAPYERTFEEEVLERLARIETNLTDLPSMKERLGTLEGHRNWLAGAVAALTGLAGFLHFKA